jgi:hypothetical protein
LVNASIEMSMNYLEFNEYLNKNKCEGQSKVDVIALYTHYYLLKWGFGLLNEKRVRRYWFLR